MPTFEDSRKDAAEAMAALTRLAQATRTFSDPVDAIPVMGDLISGVRSLRQVLDQLADTHLAARTHDGSGTRAPGANSALAAADELHQAGTLLETVEWRLEAASQHSARVAAQPETPRRWISVVFLQGEETAKVLDLLETSGADTAITHLVGYDYGAETTQAALENGYVYDTPPTGALDRTATSDPYTLVYNPFTGTVNLLREYPAPPDPALVNTPRSTPARMPNASRRQELHAGGREPVDWFPSSAHHTTPSRRALSL